MLSPSRRLNTGAQIITNIMGFRVPGLGCREIIAILRFHIPCIIVIYGTSNIPQSDIGNYSSPHIRLTSSFGLWAILCCICQWL